MQSYRLRRRMVRLWWTTTMRSLSATLWLTGWGDRSSILSSTTRVSAMMFLRDRLPRLMKTLHKSCIRAQEDMHSRAGGLSGVRESENRVPADHTLGSNMSILKGQKGRSG